jgi:hypothetical protein
VGAHERGPPGGGGNEGGAFWCKLATFKQKRTPGASVNEEFTTKKRKQLSCVPL